MESHAYLLQEVSILASTNNAIHAEVLLLQSEQAEVEAQFETNVQALNGLIQKFPELGTMLLRDNPNPAATQDRTLVEDNANTTNSIVTDIPLRECCEPLQETIASLRIVGMETGAAAEDAKSRQLRAADLASRAARHVDRCTLTRNSILQAKAENQTRVAENLRAIADLEAQLAEATQMANQMAERARGHDSDADGHQIFFWTTFWIPIVNLVTIPVSLSERGRHQNSAQEYRASEARCRQEMQQKQAEKHGLEAKSGQLDGAYNQLETALQSCSGHERQASGLKDSSKILTDQYGMISTGIRQVLLALDPLDIEVEVRDWDTLRFTALYCMRDMLSVLHSEGRLEESNVTVLERLRAIPISENSVGIFALEWDGME